MALQDLTPQLRTRLSKVERVVGWFVIVAALLLVTGFVYYVYQTAKRKGWFLTQAPYYTFVQSAAGLKVGDPVKLMGFDVGEITEIEAQPPDDPLFNVFIAFRIKSPYYGYLWVDSKTRIASSDLLGNRYLEVTKGLDGHPTYREETRKVFNLWEKKILTGIWDIPGQYRPISKKSKGYWLQADESPALSDRIDALVKKIEAALPNILNLTNQLKDVLTNSTELTANLNHLVSETRPVMTNLAVITAQISDPHGSLGEWLIPTNLQVQLQQTLASANTTLTNTDASLTSLAENLDKSLINLANLTSNLNAQVQVNTNILSELSTAIVHTDDLVQGLKRHWLLRSAFRSSTNRPPLRPIAPKTGKVP
ncbi:MAG: MCE family protein [Verrucomicrobia bacterium]|nr:MCE family protein [Verrucomicrobiota bacterium]